MNATQKYRALSRRAAMEDVAGADLLQPEELLFGRYRPLETLGTGGYGTVFSAWDESLKRRVAIKQIPLEEHEDEGLEEARTAALLNHPNIVSVFDFVASDNEAYIIMEYIEGLALSQIDRLDLDDDSLAAIAKGVGAALSFAHKNGVLHVDIKPANILINSEGHIKLIDFGISRLSGVYGHDSASGGTVGYMPLEQLEGNPSLAATDQWAFAAVMYELLAGEYPYENEQRFSSDMDEMLAIQQKGEPELLSVDTPALDDAFKIALSRDPRMRFSRVSALTEALLLGLGSPSQGRKNLAHIALDNLDDEIEHEDADYADAEDSPETSRKKIWGLIIRSLAGGLATSGLWYLGQYVGISQGNFMSLAGLAIGMGAVVTIAPRLGSLMAGLTAAVLLGIIGNLYIAALALSFVLVVWWIFLGRKSNAVALIGTILVTFATAINFTFKPTLVQLKPALFSDGLHWINIALASLFIVLSLVAYFLSTERTLSER